MKVLIATPMYGSMCMAGYAASMISLMKKASSIEGLEIDFLYGLNEALITRARNTCANVFLESDFTHLLFIDSDIQFNADQIIQMMLTEEDLVCVIYPKKKIDWKRVREAVLNGMSDENLQAMASSEYLFVPAEEGGTNRQGLIEIERAATGMMMISKTVFNTLADKVPEFLSEGVVIGQNNPKYTKEFFFTSTDPETKVFLHEDFNFCKLWRDAGGKIYGAPWVKLYHIGTQVYG
jgi:hypothetical protein